MGNTGLVRSLEALGLSLDGGDGVLIPVCSKGVLGIPGQCPPDASIASQAMFQKCRYLCKVVRPS